MLKKFHSAEEKYGRIKSMSFAFHHMTLHRKKVSCSKRVTSQLHWASRKVKAKWRQPISGQRGRAPAPPHHSSRRRTWGEEAARPAWLESLHIRTATQTRGIVQLVRAQVPEAQSCVSLPRLSSCPGALRPPVQPISDPRDPRAHSEEGELDFS